jgi:hypothetical protein
LKKRINEGAGPPFPGTEPAEAHFALGMNQIALRPRRYPLNPALRKAYDLRGTIGRTLGDEDARSLGLRFAALARARGQSRIAVSRDAASVRPDWRRRW